MENKANKEVRKTLKDSKLKHWKLADELKISETTLVRKLRKELPENEKQKILKIISEIKKGE